MMSHNRGNEIRTHESWSQSPLPYRLAIPLYSRQTLIAVALPFELQSLTT